MFDINKAIEDISKGLDNLFTSDEERAKYALKMAELKSKMFELEHSYRKEASKTKLFNWVGVMLMCAWIYDVAIRDHIIHYFVFSPTDLDEKAIFSALLAMVGISRMKK